MICIKLDIQTNQVDRIKQYQQQYSTYLHLAYNRLLDGMKQSQCYKMTNYNNIQLLDSWLRQSATYEAKAIIKKNQLQIQKYNNKLNRRQQLLNKDKRTYYQNKELKRLNKIKYPKVIFGGRNNHLNRLKGLISKEEYQQNRLSLIYSIGQSINIKGNRKFQIKDNNTIIFKPNRKEHIELHIKSSKKYQQYLKILMLHQQQKDLPITYKLSYKHIQISFDQSILQQKYKQYKHIKNRIISIDMNPNYIGYSIIDWKSSQQFELIDKGVLSIKQINDYDNQHPQKLTYITNKRHFEILECNKFLINKMIHYKCSLFAIEDLSINSKDHQKGKQFNRLVNNKWCRTIFVNNLQKWTNIYNIKLIKINPAYSSFIGNMVFRSLKLPDMILASIQISRRGFEFYHQYLIKDKDIKKNIIWIKLTNNVRSKVIQSLEELGLQNIIWKDLIEL